MTSPSLDVADDVVRREGGADEIAVHGDLRDSVGHIADLFDDELLLRDLDDDERLLLAEADLHAEWVLVARVLVHAAGRHAFELGRTSEWEDREVGDTETAGLKSSVTSLTVACPIIERFVKS